MRIIKDQRSLTMEVDQEEINAILYGLGKIKRSDWKHDTVEFHGYGGIRSFSVEKSENMINKLMKQ